MEEQEGQNVSREADVGLPGQGKIEGIQIQIKGIRDWST
jgi:hypothetical protein